MQADTEKYVYFDSLDTVNMDDVDSTLKAESGHGRAEKQVKLVETLFVNNTSKNRFFLPDDV